MLEDFFCNIIKCLNISSEQICNNNNNRKFVNKPGWSDHVSDLYKYSREIRQLWLDNGKPRQGPLFNEFSRSKVRFKYALRFIQKN